MTFEEYIAGLGFRQTEDGRFAAPDGESFLDADQLQQMYGAGYQSATASPDRPLYGSGGPAGGITVGGTPYQQIGPWANNSADPATALQMEIDHLKQYGVEPIYDPKYGWIAPDVSVDPKVAAAHPTQDSSSIFDFGPFILGGGLAALAAGVGGLGVAGALDAGAGAATGAGALSDAAIADIVAAEGGFSALPSAGMAGTAPLSTAALPESYWSMTAEAPGSTVTDVIPQAFTAPAPLPPIDPATIPLTAAEQQAAWAKAGLSPIGKSPFITGSALGDAVAKGALAGAGTSAIGGGDVGKGALMGAVTGGATNVISPAVSGLTAFPAVNQAIGNAALSAGTAGLTGGDPVTAVGNSAARSGANAAGGALWSAASGALDGSLMTPTPEPVNNDLGERRQVEAAEQAQQEQERQYAEDQRIEQERRAAIEAEAQRQFQIQQQIENEFRRQVEAAEQAQQEQEARYAEATRADGSPKGDGFLGPLTRPDGRTSTELSAGVNIDGKETEVPLLVPTLTQDEVDYLLDGNKPTDEIVQKAVDHANERISAGQSPFAGSGEATYTPSESTAGALPNSEETNMAESNWWDELTSEFGNAGEVANVEPAGGLNEVDQWLSDIGATRNPDGSINWESVDNSGTLKSLGTIDEGPGALDFSNAADSLGLQQMGEAAGLKGDALAKFVASGGTQGSTRAGGGGIGTGAGIPFGASGGAGGSATNANTININNGGGALGNLPSWALPALVAGLALDNPDRTSTTEVKYPDWYNTGAKSALAQADKFGALGPDSIAPLSGNENEAIEMAKDSTGKWIPQLDKAASTLDESKNFYSKAGALNDAVPGFVNAASGRADAAMPYFGAAGALAGSVPGYLDRAGGQVDAAMPYFGKAGETADTVGGYLNRATGQVDASMPYFGKAAGQVGEAMPYFGKAGDMADSVSGYLNKSGALADQAAGGIPSVNLSAYMNPYLDNVLAPIARRNELAKAAALNDIRAKAGMRGAFGGSRSTLLESETAGTADRNMNEAEAGIRANAFNTGLSTAQADLNRILQASGQYGALGGVAGNTAGIYGGIGKTVADTGNIYSGVGKNIADTAGTFTTAGNVAGNTAGVYGNIGKGIADTAGVFNNSGVVATGAANSLTGTGKGVADTADIFNKSAGALTTAANADTNIGRSLIDTSSGYRSNAGAFGSLTDADIARLMGTGATSRSVDQAKLNAPLTAIGGYAAALRGAGTPGATTTNVAPEASKIGQAATGLGALIGANKAGLF